MKKEICEKLATTCKFKRIRIIGKFEMKNNSHKYRH